jgi:hypothetical protein
LPVRVGSASRDALLQASAAKVIDGRKPKLSASLTPGAIMRCDAVSVGRISAEAR